MGDINVVGVVAIVIFYVAILLVGLWAARRRKRNEEEAMLAGRSIGMVVGTFTLTATWVGGGYINGTAEVVYNPDGGLIFAQAPLGYATSLFLGGLFFAKVMRGREYFTMIDPFQHKYGARLGGLLYIPALLGEIFWSASILTALGATISVVLGLGRVPSIVASSCIAVFYTLLGGLYSVVYTDIIQLICIFVGLWLSIPFAMTHEAVSSISENNSRWLGQWNINKTGQWLDYAFLLICGGIPWQVYFQRVLSCKTPKKAQVLSFFASIGCIVMVIPAILIGAIGASTDWSQTGFSASGAANATLDIDKSLILPMVLQYLTPTAVSFIGLGAVSAAVMSSADSSILSASSMFARNIYKMTFRQKASVNEVLWVMRISIFAVGACATVIALAVDSIYALFVLCSDLVYVILFPQLCCVIYFQDGNAYGAAFGYFMGLLFRIGGGERKIGLEPFIRFPFYSEEHGQLFPYRTACMLISLLSTVVVSYIAKALFAKGILPASADFMGAFAEREERVLENNEKDAEHPLSPVVETVTL